MIKTEVLWQSFQRGYRLDYQLSTNHFKAVKEKKGYCCGIKKRAKGESAKQLAALKAATEHLKSSLAEDLQPEDNERLYQVYQKLKPRLSYLRSHTTGFFGWLCSLFRAKKETKALKELKKEILKLQHLMIRSEKISLEALKKLTTTSTTSPYLSNEILFKRIEKELPHLIRSTPPTTADFGITETTPYATTPFFLRRFFNNIYLYFPPAGPAPHTETPRSVYIQNIRQDVQTYYYAHLVNHKLLIARSCDNLSSENLAIRNVRCDAYKVLLSQKIEREKGSVILLAEVFNPLTGVKETSQLAIKTTTTKASVDKWVRSLISESERRISELENFIETTFSADLNSKKVIRDPNGISVDWTGKYHLGCMANGKKIHATSLGLGKQSYDYLKAYKEQAIENLRYQNEFKASSKASLNFLENSARLTIDADDAKQTFTISLVEGSYWPTTTPIKIIPFNTSLESTVQIIKKDLYLKKNAFLAAQTLESVSPISDSENIPRLPKVSLDKLLTWARQVDYNEHDLSKANDGCSIASTTIKRQIGFIVSVINQHKKGVNVRVMGIPNHTADRKIYFKDLEARLTHIIKALERPENKCMIPEVIINLGVGGCHCGGRWKDEVNKYYNMLCTPEINESNIDFDQWLQYLFDQQKKETVNQMVARVRSANTGHVLFRYLTQLKQDKITVPGWTMANYNDSLSYYGGGLSGSAITTAFKETFNFSKLFEQTHLLLNKHLSDYSKPIICQNFGSQVTNRLQTAVKEHLLPYNLEKKAAYDAATSDQQRSLILNELIDDHQLITEDPRTSTMTGVTYERTLLLMLQTGHVRLPIRQNVYDLLLQLKKI